MPERIEPAGRLPQTARPDRPRVRRFLHSAQQNATVEERLRFVLALTGQLVRGWKSAGLGRARSCRLGDTRSGGPDFVRIDDHVFVAQADARATWAAPTGTIHVAEIGFAHDASDQCDGTRWFTLFVGLCGG